MPQSTVFIERDWLSANHIIFCDGDNATIVDTGYKKHIALMTQLVEHEIAQRSQQLARPIKLNRIINTHLHSDHCGGNASLQQRYPNVETWIPAGCAQMVAQWDEKQLTYQATVQECDRFGFTHTIEFGQSLHLGGNDWQVIGGLGHDPTMFVLYCPALKLLISADALWENGFGITFPELENKSGFAEQKATLDTLSQLDVNWVIPGHGPAFRDFAGALQRAYSKLEYLRANPERHKKLAARSLLKFLLLDKESIELSQLPALLSRGQLFTEMTTQESLAEASQRLAQELCSIGAAKQVGNTIYNL